MKIERTIVDGKEIEHLDVIHHSTTTEFGFKDRIKILFGAKIFIDSKIYTKNEYCSVVIAEAKGHTSRLFKRRKQKGLQLKDSID